MNVIQQIENWGDTHHTRWADALRMVLGLVILAKGLSFISDTDALNQLILDSRFGWAAFILTHYIACVHLIGGILIALGLLTRVAIAFQIPVLLGAVLFVNQIGSFSAINSEFTLSLLVLMSLLFFFVYGSGPWSVDEYMRTHKEK